MGDPCRKVVPVRRIKATASLLISLAAGCAAVPPPKADADGHDPAALTVVAEIALARGDCKVAAESYAEAAQRGEAPLARRASEVALACENVPAARKSSDRWTASPISVRTFIEMPPSKCVQSLER